MSGNPSETPDERTRPGLEDQTRTRERQRQDTDQRPTRELTQPERGERVREQIAAQAGEDFDPEDVALRPGRAGAVRGELEEAAIRRETAEDVTEGTPFDESDVSFEEIEEGIQAGISEEARRREAAAQLSEEIGEDIAREDIELTDTGAALSDEAQRREGLEDLQGATAINLTGEDLVLEDGSVGLSEQAEQAERRAQIQQAIEDAAGDFERFSVEDLEVRTEDGEQIIAPEESAIERERQEARQAALESAATEFESFTVEDLEIGTEDGERIVEPVSDAVQRERQEQLEQVASESDRFSVQDLEVSDGQIQPTEEALSRERGEIRAETFSQLQEATDTDISQDDIEFTESGVELSDEIRRQEALDDLQSETDIQLTTEDIAITESGATITEQAQRREAAAEFGSGVDTGDIVIEDGRATVSEFAQEQIAADELTSEIRNQISQDVFGEIGSGPNEFALSTADIRRTGSGFALTESGREAVEQAQLETAVDKLDAETPYNQVTRDDVTVRDGSIQLNEETQLQITNTFRGDDALEMSEVRFTDEGIQLTEGAQVDRFEEAIGQDITQDQARFDQGQLDVEETERALAAQQFEAQIREQGFDISGVSASDVERQDGQFVLGNAVQEQIEEARIEPTDVGDVSPAVAEQLQTGAVGLTTEFDVTTELTPSDRRELAADRFNQRLDTGVRIDETAVELTGQGPRLREGVVEGIEAEQRAEALQTQFELRDERVAAELSAETGLDIGPGAVDVDGGEVSISEEARQGIQFQRQADQLQREFERAQTLENVATAQGVDLDTEFGSGTETSQRLARDAQIEQAIVEQSSIDESQIEVARGETFITDPGLRERIELGRRIGQLQATQGVDATTEFGSGTVGGLGPASERLEDVALQVAIENQGVTTEDVQVTPAGDRFDIRIEQDNQGGGQFGNIEQTQLGRDVLGTLEGYSQDVRAGVGAVADVTASGAEEIAEFVDPTQGIDRSDERGIVGDVVAAGGRGAGTVVDPFGATAGLIRTGDYIGAGLEAGAEGRFGDLAEVEGDVIESFRTNEPVDIDFAEGGFIGASERAGSQLAAEGVSAIQERPVRTGAFLAGSLVGTAGGTLAASRISGTAGRAVPFAFQPGEEILTRGATATLGRTARGQRALDSIGGQLDPENIALYAGGRARDAIAPRLRAGTRTDAETNLGVVDRLPSLDIDTDGAPRRFGFDNRGQLDLGQLRRGTETEVETGESEPIQLEEVIETEPEPVRPAEERTDVTGFERRRSQRIQRESEQERFDPERGDTLMERRAQQRRAERQTEAEQERTRQAMEPQVRRAEVELPGREDTELADLTEQAQEQLVTQEVDRLERAQESTVGDVRTGLDSDLEQGLETELGQELQTETDLTQEVTQELEQRQEQATRTLLDTEVETRQRTRTEPFTQEFERETTDTLTELEQRTEPIPEIEARTDTEQRTETRPELRSFAGFETETETESELEAEFETESEVESEVFTPDFRDFEEEASDDLFGVSDDQFDTGIATVDELTEDVGLDDDELL